MKVLSLFDWIACARVALQRAWITVEEYCSIEFDKYAREVANKNWPDIIRTCNDVRDFIGGAGYDLIIGGSPCQDLSIAKKNRKWLEGEKSNLFYEYVRILKECKPRYFILENVASMHKNEKEKITAILAEIYPDTEVHMINASLVSAQNRKRYFWTNIKGVTQPEDKKIFLKKIIIDWIAEREKSLVITATYSRACPRDYFIKHNRQLIKVWEFNSGGQGDRVYSIEWKSVTLSAHGGGRGAKTWLYETTKGIYRKLHPIECERLQCLPDNYTSCGGIISNSQRYKMLGNAFNVDVIAHILSFIK